MSDAYMPTEDPLPQPVDKPKRKQRCANCKYLEQGAVYLDDDTIGACRRHAPQPVIMGNDESIANWPLVFLEDWCGEFA
jgi:hypothetical protein